MSIFANYKAEQNVLPAFSASDWLLIWLALDKSKSIKGKTAFIKQLFVAGKEIAPQMEKVFAFYPHRFGPYSKEFENALQQLERKGAISVNVQEEIEGFSSMNKRYDYTLQPAGEAIAITLMKRVPPSIRDKLIQYRRLLSRMGFWGIIQYVYSNYPEYATSSEIRMT